MERVESEAFGLGCPGFADVLVGREALESFQSAAEVVGSDEVGEVLAELIVVFVVEPLHRSLLDGSVHSLDLPVGPGMPRFGQPMVDAVPRASELEGMSAEDFSPCHSFFDLSDGRTSGAGRRELNAVVGEDRMDLVGHRRDEVAQEVGRDLRRGSIV